LLVSVQSVVVGASLTIAIWGMVTTSAHMILLQDLRRPDDPLRTAAFIYVSTASVVVVMLIVSAALTLRLLPLVTKATVGDVTILNYLPVGPMSGR